MTTFSGIFEFSIFKISPEGKKTEIDDYYQDALGDAIYDHVSKFLDDCEDVTEYGLQVETAENNGGPLIDYTLTVTSGESPMGDLSLEDITVPWPEKGKGWRVGTCPGGIRFENGGDSDDEDEDSDDEDEDSEEGEAVVGFSPEALHAAAEKSELYPPFVAFLESLPGVKARVDSETGGTVGVGGYGDVFAVFIGTNKAGQKRYRAEPIGFWDDAAQTIRGT